MSWCAANKQPPINRGLLESVADELIIFEGPVAWGGREIYMKITTSEARAEAIMLTLRLWLRLLPKDKAAWLRASALLEAKSIGHPDITEEVEWLFHNLTL